VLGDLGKLGSRYIFNLKLIDVMRDKTENRVSDIVSDDVGLFLDRIPQMVDNLITKDLRKTKRKGGGTSGDAGLDPPKGLAVPADMAYIPAGTFLMGYQNEQGDEDEWPQHAVKLDAFLIDKYEATKREFERVMNYSTSTQKGCATCPIDNVTWFEAKEYCDKTGKRLPTEAEWEYAARGGESTIFAYGNVLSSDQANFNGRKPFGGAPQGIYRKKIMPVGSFKPNDYGLYDMHGNLWEWCADWYGKEYYRESSYENPEGPSTGMYRVLRGGCWVSEGGCLRSANRIGYKPTVRLNIFGFRCVKDIPETN
ncbi:MAG: SUMF1/EgtB/PvdO family nonheme iron enzyme, partial [Chitinivibrionales bacterium]|nr:SUMF1/EgtB/PvdO family nonheme iron enzyme [Chitinivibrionales bacterium]